MSILQEAKDILKYNGINNVIEFFLTNYEQGLLDVSIACGFLRNTKNLAQITNHSIIKFSEVLFEEKEFETIYILYESRNFDSLSSNEVFIYLKSIRNLGHIKEFKTKAKEINEYLLLHKYYAAYKEFIKQFEELLNHDDFFKVGKILYYIETCDSEKIIALINEEEKQFIKNIGNTRLPQIYLNLLEQYEEDNIIIYKKKLKLKFILSKSKVYEVLKKDIIDFLLIASDVEDFSLIVESIHDDELRRDLNDFVKVKFKVKLNNISPPYKIMKQDINYEVNSPKVDLFEDKYEFTIFEQEQQDSGQKEVLDYFLSSEEELILKYFKHERDLVEYTEDLVISFLRLEFYSVCEYILKQMSDSANKLYLLAEVKKNKNEYGEAIYYCNKAIQKYDLKGEKILAFEFLKSESFEALGDHTASRRCIEKIVAEDPTFRNAKEKLIR